MADSNPKPSTPGATEPLVWRNLTQPALDDAYDQSVYAPNRMQILERYQFNSVRTRERLGQPRRFEYGNGAKESLDVFSSTQPNAPINVFIHGGAWRSGAATDYAFLADLYLSAGVHLVLPDFDWVQDRDGDLLPIADQVRRAIAWVGKHAAELGADPHQIFLSGHSSGAHLAGVALTTNWQTEYQLPANLIKGALLCSGMYELEPVALSARSSYIRFTDECIAQLSAMRALERVNTPLIIAYGDQETPEFQRQSREFFDSLSATRQGVGSDSARCIVGKGYNHFEILETLANPFGLLGEAQLKMLLPTNAIGKI